MTDTVEEAKQRVIDAYERILSAKLAVERALESYVDEAIASFDARLAELERDHKVRLRTIETETAQAVREAADAEARSHEDILEGAKEKLRPFPWVVQAFDSDVWGAFVPDGPLVGPEVLRVGSLPLAGGRELPALLGLEGVGHLIIDKTPEVSEAEQLDLLRCLLFRAMVGSVPGAVRLTLIDSAAGADLATFLDLPEKLRGARVTTRPDDVATVMRETVTHIERVIQERLRTRHDDLRAYNAAEPATPVAYNLVAISRFPAGFDERSAADLKHIAEAGPRAGVYVVMTRDAALELPKKNFNVKELEGTARIVTLGEGGTVTWQDELLGRVDAKADRLPTGDRVGAVLRAVGAEAAKAGATLPFSQLAVEEYDIWIGSSLESLKVAVGRKVDGSLQEIELGRAGGVVFNGLIGGMVGSGKSNLIRVLLTQLVRKYSPAELGVYLLDMSGVGFAEFEQTPQMRVFALESEPEFALSVLKALREELRRREQLCRERRIGGMEEYRGTGGVMPCQLLVIDEFQRVAGPDTPTGGEAVTILEDIVRNGRKMGIYVILCSQTPSFHGGGGRSEVMEQLGLRVCFQASERIAEAVLGEQKNAVGELGGDSGKGVFFTTAATGATEIVRVAWLPRSEVDAWLLPVRSKPFTVELPPRITFSSTATAELTSSKLLSLTESASAIGEVTVWLGEAVEIKPPTAAFLEPYRGSNLLIAGGRPEERQEILLAALVSIAAQKSPNDAAFWYLDWSRPGETLAVEFSAIAAEGLPHTMEFRLGDRLAHAGVKELCDLVTTRTTSGELSPTHYVFVSGLNRWREARPEHDGSPRGTGDPDLPGSSRSRGAPSLQPSLARIADEGPDVGVHLIVGVDDLAGLGRAMGRSALGAFDFRASLRLSEDDSRNILETYDAGRLADDRALFRNQSEPARYAEKFKPFHVRGHLLELLRAVANKWGAF